MTREEAGAIRQLAVNEYGWPGLGVPRLVDALIEAMNALGALEHDAGPLDTSGVKDPTSRFQARMFLATWNPSSNVRVNEEG